MTTLGEIEFHTTVAQLSALPPPDRAEVALVGRSNAGKSSALNALSNRKRMAFISKTPGRTQHLNFFRLSEIGGYLVDLPGYGYAKVPDSERDRWGELTSGYLLDRPSLCGVVLIIDARRLLTTLDRGLLAWLKPNVAVHILLSKADKLTRQQSKVALQNLKDQLPQPATRYSSQLFSSKSKEGVFEAADKIRSWIKTATETHK